MRGRGATNLGRFRSEQEALAALVGRLVKSVDPQVRMAVPGAGPVAMRGRTATSICSSSASREGGWAPRTTRRSTRAFVTCELGAISCRAPPPILKRVCSRRRPSWRRSCARARRCIVRAHDERRAEAEADRRVSFGLRRKSVKRRQSCAEPLPRQALYFVQQSPVEKLLRALLESEDRPAGVSHTIRYLLEQLPEGHRDSAIVSSLSIC